MRHTENLGSGNQEAVGIPRLRPRLAYSVLLVSAQIDRIGGYLDFEPGPTGRNQAIGARLRFSDSLLAQEGKIAWRVREDSQIRGQRFRDHPFPGPVERRRPKARETFGLRRGYRAPDAVQVVATKRVPTTGVAGTTALVAARRLMPAIAGVLHQPTHAEDRYHHEGSEGQESDRFLTHVHKPKLLLDVDQQTLPRMIGSRQLLLHAQPRFLGGVGQRDC